MIFARFYRPDLVTGEHTHAVGYALVMRGSLEHMHLAATQATERHNAYAYRLFEGPTFRGAKPTSLLHVVRG